MYQIIRICGSAVSATSVGIAKKNGEVIVKITVAEDNVRACCDCELCKVREKLIEAIAEEMKRILFKAYRIEEKK